MGYRSDVCLCLKNRLLPRFDDLLSSDEAAKSVDGLLGDAEHISDDETGAGLWLWQDVKWYADNEDVATIEHLLNCVDEADFLFIRIGDDSDDTEVQGCYWDNPFGLYLSRQICFERPQNGNC